MPKPLLSKKFLPLIVAAVLGLIATVLINKYIQQKTEEAKRQIILRQQSLTTVVVAKQDIPAGAVLKESMLEEKTVNKNMLQPRAATSIERVVGKITVAPISKGEQVLLNKVTIPAQEGSLAMKIPSGKRAVTIPVDDISAVGGMIKPGDYVDIVGIVPVPSLTPEGKQVTEMTTMPLFQNVLVLAVGQEFASVPRRSVSDTKKEKKASRMITLALTPQEANLVIFVQEQGRIRLVLRSPGDAQVQPVVPASWDALFRTIMPQAFQEKVEEPSKPKKKVEIYHGLKREVKDLE